MLEIINAPLPNDIQPITLGPAEAFYSTLTNSAYVALLISLPVILYQFYAFLLPAFSPTEKRVALPLMLMIPVLFITGVVFCYFVVLTPAMQFLLNFNADEFNTQVRARDYYSFVTLLMLAMGLGFQIPVGVLAACKLRITSPEKLRRGRRYAVVVIVVLASLLPTLDPLTLVLESIPLYAALRAQHPDGGGMGASARRDLRGAGARGQPLAFLSHAVRSERAPPPGGAGRPTSRWPC